MGHVGAFGACGHLPAWHNVSTSRLVRAMSEETLEQGETPEKKGRIDTVCRLCRKNVVSATAHCGGDSGGWRVASRDGGGQPGEEEKRCPGGQRCKRGGFRVEER